jgi:16S rRNA (cytosine1402-N4)-methyltransferase
MDRYQEHVPVLKDEVIRLLNIKSDGIYADCTMGYGGHGQAILEKLDTQGIYIGIDKDEYAIKKSDEWIHNYPAKTFAIKDDYKNFKNIAMQIDIKRYDGILIDMGLSSVQLDEAGRGFSYHHSGQLDMRMDRSHEVSAWDIVNTYEENEISKIIFAYGEEKHARMIARAICRARKKETIDSTTQFAEIIKEAYPLKERYKGKHPARKTFQALRIAVNNELTDLDKAIEEMTAFLAKDGVLAIITFHSLEDRIVKETFNKLAKGCTCPKDFPVCVCGAKQDFKILTHKPIIPGTAECNLNKRSRSAKLRALKRIGY